ncbi:MAG: metallophosphoesterase family protein, partial [Gemmataceae bacterium]
AITKAKCHLHENFGHLDLDGITVAFLHGHESSLLRDLIQSQAYDFLFHGHTHLRADSLQGKTRVVNPGALHRTTEKSFVIMDTSKGDLQTIILD